MLTFKFWKGTAIRAVRTFAQTFGAGSLGNGLDLWHLDWKASLGVALGAAVGSVLMSIDRAPQDPSEQDVLPTSPEAA
ncbi:hypothetical protein FHT44_005142 [Mycolicibacterium sp. BK634]|uniref:holin n=1 Tax=Mycolicibacterium sp. BK634 TaxID=2587099 RepID=UPI00161CA688|nr:holin [Mycolicibacterium sp. BK634]MBB3752630.1 hypothetical protein [Mycolicibacterium sp. BK634]